MFKFNSSGILKILILLILALIIISPDTSHAQRRVKEKPENSLEILNYKWKFGGTGTNAVLQSITIHNKGKKDYKNISISVDLYSYDDIPLGSIKSVIKDSIAGGMTKTFENVDFGLMNTGLQKTVFRITGADTTKGGEIRPGDFIVVKDWEWSGASYGTEGILKFITLENKSDKSFKDIKLVLDTHEINQTKRIHFTALIKDVLPAKSTQTYKNINVGFRYSGATKTIIRVADAKIISIRELKYRMAKKGVKIDTSKLPVTKEYENEPGEEDRNLTLAERYRKNVLKENPESGGSINNGLVEQKISPSMDTGEILSEDNTYLNEQPEQYNTRIDNALTENQMLREEAKLFPKVFKDIVIVSANADENQPSEETGKVAMNTEQKANEVKTNEVPVYRKQYEPGKKNIFKRAVNWSKNLVGLSGDDEDNNNYIENEVAAKPSDEQAARHPYTDVQKNAGSEHGNAEKIEDYEIEGDDEDQEPLPNIDIQVTDFKLGAALTGTVGNLKEITLLNTSRITYTNIKLEATSYSRGDSRPLASYRFTINEILPRRSKRTFKNVRLGFLSSEPQELVIRVTDAISVN